MRRTAAAGRYWVESSYDWSAGEVGVFVVYPSRKLLPAKTRLLVDFIAAAFPRSSGQDLWLERAGSARDSGHAYRGAARRLVGRAG